MLTGQAAFGGETVTDVLAAIVTRDPDWSLLPPGTPSTVRRLLHRCLERDWRKRLADAGEARFQIEEALAGASAEPSSAVAPARTPRARVIVPWAIAAILLAALAGVVWRSSRPAQSSPLRYSLEVPHQAFVVLTSRPSVALSPDGSIAVFAAASDGIERLYLRRLNSFNAEPLAGTEGGSHPVISPDNRWLAFVRPNKLLKIPITGGPVQELADTNDPRGLSWDSSESIVFTPTTLGGIFRIPAAGGKPVPVTTTVPQQERTHRWPQELPGGKAIIFTVGSFASPDNYDNASIQALVLASGERRTILDGAAMARYVAPGYLLFLKGTHLLAAPFDAGRLEITGTPVGVLQDVASDSTTGAAHFSWSSSGSLFYVASQTDAGALLPMDVDRAGNPQALPMGPGAYSDPALSPDGQQLAVSLVRGGGRDIWVYHRQRKTFSRMTFAGQNVTPAWSRDGSMLYYVAINQKEAQSAIYRRPSDGSRDAEQLTTLPERTYLGSLTLDEKAAVVEFVTPGPSESDIYTVELRKDAKPVPLVVTRFNEYGSKLSPDGRWLAYLSTESSRPEVYVRAANGTGGRWQVSIEGGDEPKWSADGRELYYRYGNVLMAAKIGAGTVFEMSTPVRLFSGVYNLRNESGLSYDVDPKTGRFVMIRLRDDKAAAPALRVITNWTRELAAVLK